MELKQNRKQKRKPKTIFREGTFLTHIEASDEVSYNSNLEFH